MEKFQNIVIFKSQIESNGTKYHAFSGAVIGWIAPQSYVLFKYLEITSCEINVFSVQQWNSHAGALIGELQFSSIVSIFNIQIENTSIITNANISVSYSGGFVGKQLINTNMTIQDSQITNSNISAIQQYYNISFSGSYIGQTFAVVFLQNTSSESIQILCKAETQSWAGGIIGQFNTSITTTTILQVNFVIIQNINITSQSIQIGAKMVGNYYEILIGTIQITNSFTKGVNFLNEIQVSNCLDIISIDSQNGC
ncbi:Hypothetical_protein [Hexamita inflata]|uniref:Hypothetical_protein n=1 Tax=Hexamita inflata TaxID=28002 RepID=A0ABP1JAT9_9EUKA